MQTYVSHIYKGQKKQNNNKQFEQLRWDNIFTRNKYLLNIFAYPVCALGCCRKLHNCPHYHSAAVLTTTAGGMDATETALSSNGSQQRQRKSHSTDLWPTLDKQLSSDLFLGPIQFFSVQARADGIFNICHLKEKLVFQDFAKAVSFGMSQKVWGGAGVHFRHIL